MQFSCDNLALSQARDAKIQAKEIKKNEALQIHWRTGSENAFVE